MAAETIHPFADGNGRTGRALIHLIMRCRGLTPRVVPPVSLILASHADTYIAALTSYRHVGAADSPDAQEAAGTLIDRFAADTARACADSERFGATLDVLEAAWRDRPSQPRVRGSGTRQRDHWVRARIGQPGREH